MDCIIPTAISHIEQLKLNIKFIHMNLPIEDIVVIGSENVRKELHGEQVRFLDENSLGKELSLSGVRRLIENKNGNVRRAGWYLQQFIKMQYAFCTDEEYYLLWDADTIPIKEIKFFNEEKMLFNLKDERHLPYFSTISKLFRVPIQTMSRSFISEGMIIKNEIMKEMIDEIESNDQLFGKYFYEKILNAITEKDLSRSGFSEFETYGNYLYTRHPELFQYRPLKTQRHGMFYYGKIPDVDELKNSLYDTVSFEEYDTRKERILRGIKQICGYVKKFV